MGLGSTAKKLQRVADMAEDLVGRLNDLRDRVIAMEETVDDNSDRLTRLEDDVAAQRALLEALAEAEGIDVATVLESVEEAPAAESPTDEEPTPRSDEGA